MQHGSSRNPKQEALPNAIFGNEPKNWTALHESVVAGDDKRVEILLFSNVDRMCKESNYGNTALHEAASRGFSRCVKLICAPPALKVQHKEKNRLKTRVANTIEAIHNSTLGITNNEGLSALHLAVQNGHNQSSRELLMAGADPDVQNNYGDTPLHTACRYGHAGATRILLSALCDPNKTNLNGDTPLHITCAMGRRKLTRILLESDARLSIKNAQGETPQSIATRKNYREIIEILSTPRRMRNRKEKVKESSSPQRKCAQENSDKVINWSPYGCHYFPDPRAFPSPKLETLPKEPLKPGEQYFLDLAGHIHKGPVSAGNTCYCGPFFRHIENKLNCNRKSLKKYVHKTKERLGHKVQALAIKTNDQIEQLTRTMIADRIRCENKRQYLNECLQRGEPFRSTFDYQSRTPKVERTLSRSRSLELLETNMQDGKLSNSKSVDLLGEQAVEAIIHHSNGVDMESDTEDDSNKGPDTPVQIAQNANKDSQSSKLNELKLDFLKVSERLGDLLEKTSLIMDRDSEQESKRQTPALPLDYGTQQNAATPKIQYNKDAQYQIRDDKDSPESPHFEEYTHIMRRYPNSSETSNPSQNSNSWECETSPSASGSQPLQDPQKYYAEIGRNNNMLHTVIRALRKDVCFPDLHREEATLNENADKLCEDKVLYKELAQDTSNAMINTEPLAVSHPAIPRHIRRQPLRLTDNYAARSSIFYTNPMMNAAESGEYLDGLEMRLNPNETVGKVEIKNSEIKYLKKTNGGGQVRDMVAHLQSKIDLNMQIDAQEIDAAQNDIGLSPDFDLLNENALRLPLSNSIHKMATGHGASQHQSSPYAPDGSMQQFGIAERHIPKDAYFHELPNRSQNLRRTPFVNSGYLPSSNANLHRAEDLYVNNYSGQSQVFVAPSASFQTINSIPVPGEYVNQSGHLYNHTQRVARTVHESSAAHPLMWRNRLPPEGGIISEEDILDMPPIGLYNNVSSLV